jgi:hypothetical protein
MAIKRAGINMKRHYIKWSEVLTGNISAKDYQKIQNSVELFVQTPKGWKGIAVCYTRQEAEEFKQRIVQGRVTLKYEHEKVFKIG